MMSFENSGSALSVGYTVLDVIVHAGRIGHSAGGTAGNVAANLAHLGWRSGLAALCGDDPAGSHIRADLSAVGVNLEGVVVKRNMTTPTVIHEVLPESHRFRFGCPLCGRKLPRFQPIGVDVGVDIVERTVPDVLVVDRPSRAAVEMARITATRGGLVVFEPGKPARNDRFAELIDRSHLLKFSDQRIKLQDLPRAPRASSQIQIRTLGARGAEWRRVGQRWRRVHGFRTTVLDSAGAGDWTTAALLAALGPMTPAELASVDFDEPLRAAQAIAALSCEFIGARGLSRAANRHEISAAAMRLLRSDELRELHRQRLERSERRANCSTCLAP